MSCLPMSPRTFAHFPILNMPLPRRYLYSPAGTSFSKPARFNVGRHYPPHPAAHHHPLPTLISARGFQSRTFSFSDSSRFNVVCQVDLASVIHPRLALPSAAHLTRVVTCCPLALFVYASRRILTKFLRSGIDNQFYIHYTA